MLLSITLDQPALDEFERRLAGIEDRALDAEPVMDRIADDFLDVERVAFTSEGANVGGWAPDSAEWLARKLKAGRSSRTGLFTGTLEESLTVRHAKYGLRVTGPGELVVGSIDPVAHLFSRGTGKRFAKTRNGKPLSKPKFSGSQPAREVVVLNPVDISRWSGYVEGWLVDGLDGIGQGL